MRTLLVIGILVLAGTTSGCLDSGPQEIRVDAVVVMNSESVEEPIVPYDDVEDELTRRVVGQSVEQHENGKESIAVEVVEDSEFEDPHFDEERMGYVSYQGYTVRVNYITLD